MKKIIVILLLSVFQINFAQNITFSDPQLKNSLMGYDANSDGEISVAEALDVTVLNLNLDTITNLEGLEYFDQVTSLFLNQVPATFNLSPLQGMANLDSLELNFGSFSLQNVFQLPLISSLKKIDIYYANFTTLDFSLLQNCETIDIESSITNTPTSIITNQLTQLKSLRVVGSPLSQLDLQTNVNLEDLSLQDCSNLSVLNLAQQSQLKHIGLFRIDQITQLDLSNKPELISAIIINCPQLNQIQLTGSSAIQTLRVFDTALTSIALNDCLALESLELNSVSPQFTSLDLSQNTQLVSLYVMASGITQLDLSNQTLLENLTLTNLQLNDLNLQNNAALKQLSLINIPINQLSLSTQTQLEELDIHSCPISILDTTPLLELKILGLGNVPITSLNLTVTTQLEELYLNQIALTSVDLTQLQQLQVLKLAQLNLPSLSTLHNPNLREIDVRLCPNMTTIDISTFNANSQYMVYYVNLERLFSLESLFLKNGKTDHLLYNFWALPNLLYVCTDEDDVLPVLNSLTNLSPQNTLVVNSYCNFTPGGIYNTLTGTVHYDFNANGCDSTDPVAPFVKIGLNTTHIINYSSYSGSNGVYNYYLNEGTYTVFPEVSNTLFTVSPSTNTVSFATAGPETQTLDFCITPIGVHPDLEVIISPLSPSRPGFDARYILTYRNKGNQIASGNVQFTFDDSVLDYVIATENPTSISTGTLSWDYNQLMPFEYKAIVITFNVNGPMETPAVNIDDVLQYSAQITPIAGDMATQDNTYTYAETVIGAYDPNDKTCLEGVTVGTSKIGEYLHYLIRFQNTGNAPAENVVIKDIIDTTQFDLASLQTISTSHDSSMRIVQGNQLEFIFPNIMLPGEQVDEPASHGYVLFKIKTKTNLTQGSTVSNTASIYFDYNYPIITNTAQTTFTDLSLNENTLDGISFYPNPVKNQLHVQAKNTIESIQIFDEQGRILAIQLGSSETTVLTFEKYPKGIYFLKIRTDSGTAIRKIVKD